MSACKRAESRLERHFFRKGRGESLAAASGQLVHLADNTCSIEDGITISAKVTTTSCDKKQQENPPLLKKLCMKKPVKPDVGQAYPSVL